MPKNKRQKKKIAKTSYAHLATQEAGLTLLPCSIDDYIKHLQVLTILV